MKEIVAVLVLLILLIVIGRLVADTFRRRSDLRREHENELRDEPTHQERLDRLEERIEVLERIVTDDRSELKRRIDGL